MATNRIIGTPPISLPHVDEERFRVTPTWANWYNQVHNKLSTENHQTITAATAVNLDAQYVGISKAGAGSYAITLDAPTVAGIFKSIEMTAVSGGGTVTMSLSNCVGGTAATTCTWDAVNDTLVLVSISNKWLIFKQHGVALT